MIVHILTHLTYPASTLNSTFSMMFAIQNMITGVNIFPIPPCSYFIKFIRIFERSFIEN